MKKALWLGFMLIVKTISYCQDLSHVDTLDEVTVYSGKFASYKKNIVQKIEVIPQQLIGRMNAQNTGDLLINTGNVFVQKSQQGGSSPVLRGFEASRILLVVDGIRMNNAVYRAGHLQNVITVDQNMLSRVEVLYGPSSTLFGSDALGGVIHMRTKSPQLSSNEKATMNGSGFIRYSSANNEKTIHADANVGGKKFAWLQSYNYSYFDDMRMGDDYPDKYPDFGRRTQYINTVNNVDSIVTNNDDRVQKFSGYSQWDITQKLLFRQNAKVSHLLNLQYSNSTDIPRYDRLQDVRNGALRYAEWFYGPQERALAAYEININGAGFFDALKANLNYQHIKESRNQREYKRYDRFDSRNESISVWALTIDGRKSFRQHELTTGIDVQLNDVKSTAYRQNIITGDKRPLDTRYPNGKNAMNYFGVFGQHSYKSPNNKFVLNDGIRIQYVTLHSTIADNSFFNFPFTSIDQKHTAVTGNIGVAYIPSTSTRLTLGVSSGFRSPNVDDVARIFESNSASKQLIIPNPDLAPEYTYNIDAGFSKTIAGIVEIDASAFYTWFRNAIALAPSQLNGRDSVEYNGAMCAVYANQNVNRAFLYGFNAGLNVSFAKSFRFGSRITYTHGRLKNVNKDEVPLDHIPPVYGKTSLSFTQKRIFAETYLLYNGWKRIGDYNPSGEDNAQYATPDGMPSWMTWNVRTTFNVMENLSLQLGVENILDRNYRYFASGFSAAGRNFIVAVRASL